MNGAVGTAAVQGFLLGATLIIAIGAQNAFVLRQGLLRRHVLPICLVCAVSDALLIAAGVVGLGALVSANPTLLMAVTAGGALFLFAYAALAASRAWKGGVMDIEEAGRGGTLRAAIATVLALTFLNPHVYLDTVVLLGGLSARYEGDARLAYALGAMAASFAWFFFLGYGARLLAPLFARPSAWRVLDAIIALVMAALALRLVASLVETI